MTIQKLDDFAENGDKNLTGIDVQQGFIQAEKPARQWFNSLFNSTIKKVNEVITALEELVISTDNISDGAVTVAKLAPDFEITGGMIAKDADLDTPKLSATYAITTLDAPNINMASDGTLKRSYSPLNASTRKVGTAAGNVVERGTDGYPTNNNAIGVGQTWQDMTASRASAVTYTNSTGRPIVILISSKLQTNSRCYITVDGLEVCKSSNGNSEFVAQSVSVVIPSGSTYSASVILSIWMELR